jgi:quercetin dioxygenase-like cupin family protein
VSEQQQRRAITFFRADDAPSLEDDGIMTMAPGQIDPVVSAAFDGRQMAAGQRVRVLFKDEDPDGFSLVHAWFGPGFRLPRHSHSSDCLYYVLAGEAHMGSRILKAGDGFLVLADAPYVYTAGPEGVEVLEFRHATTFDMKIRDKTLEQWKPIIEAVRANGEHWLEAAASAV